MSSIEEVARQAGVSAATVSRTFRTPDLLNTHTRRRGLDAAELLGYSPRSKNVRSGSSETSMARTDAIGFLFFATDRDITQINEFYSPMLGAAQAEAAKLGMHLILRTASRYNPPEKMPQMFEDQAVAGTLLVGAAGPDVLSAFDNPRAPAVLVDNYSANTPHDCIVSDSFGGGYLGTEHLIRLGHRRIAFVHNEPQAVSFLNRKRGYLCALFEHGIVPDPALIITAPREEPIDASINHLLAQPNPPTAIFSANDYLAFIIMTSCRALGKSIPDDISILGFDDISFSVHSYPPLTTLRIDTELMGRLAVRRLYERIQESQKEFAALPPAVMTVPATLIERESCAPVHELSS